MITLPVSQTLITLYIFYNIIELSWPQFCFCFMWKCVYLFIDVHLSHHDKTLLTYLLINRLCIATNEGFVWKCKLVYK